MPVVSDWLPDLDRLRKFRAEHPHVLIGGGEFGTWQALIPEPDGETIVVRYSLRALFDRLDVLLGARLWP